MACCPSVEDLWMVRWEIHLRRSRLFLDHWSWILREVPNYLFFRWCLIYLRVGLILCSRSLISNWMPLQMDFPEQLRADFGKYFSSVVPVLPTQAHWQCWIWFLHGCRSKLVAAPSASSAAPPAEISWRPCCRSIVGMVVVLYLRRIVGILGTESLHCFCWSRQALASTLLTCGLNCDLSQQDVVRQPVSYSLDFRFAYVLLHMDIGFHCRLRGLKPVFARSQRVAVKTPTVSCRAIWILDQHQGCLSFWWKAGSFEYSSSFACCYVELGSWFAVLWYWNLVLGLLDLVRVWNRWSLHSSDFIPH